MRRGGGGKERGETWMTGSKRRMEGGGKERQVGQERGVEGEKERGEEYRREVVVVVVT